MSKIKRFTKVIIVIVLIAISAITFIINSININNRISYIEEAEYYSNRYGIDVYVTLAVIGTESGFNPRAVSYKGAVGLMQLMPSTAEWVSEKLNVEYNYDALLDAEYNIMLGTYYLSYLLKSFDYEYAIAAYNAGEGKVREWQSMGIEVEDIPYKETKEYVKRVKQNVNSIKNSYYLY